MAYYIILLTTKSSDNYAIFQIPIKRN